MEDHYHVYFAGQLVDGYEAAIVRDNLGKLFKAGPQVLDKLFSGKPQMVKKNCDAATAEKYRSAMQRAGAVAIIEPAQQPAADVLHGQSAQDQTVESHQATAPPPGASDQNDKQPSMAERVAALAAEADAASSDSGASDTRDQPVEWISPEDSAEKLQVTPRGTEVLLASERSGVAQRDVDTGSLAVDSSAQRLSEPPPQPPPAPDTSHLEMAAAGDDIPTLPEDKPAINPDISGLDLSPEGTDFSDCVPPEHESLELDLSGLEVSPEGAALLDDRYKRQSEPAPPSTEHLSLDD